MEAVFAYATHKKCRSQMLLAYFDEQHADKCGICDVCLDEKRRQHASEIFDDITTEVIQVLSTNPHDLASLVTSTNIGTEKEKIEVIRLLLDAGKIKFAGEKIIISD
ncbi:ATP-dependent DNA helicase RecQ [Mucilaginibacter gotjawali]|nr:RecQ family zinc-binding domain-containing protein [Mucilaginibacter gotjawali]BAU55186.1 ATP-dependent DNA helicase RecQ [Mucilaginibacter gotjawali]